MTQETLTARRDKLRADLETLQARFHQGRLHLRQAAQQIEQLRGALALCDELLTTEHGMENGTAPHE